MNWRTGIAGLGMLAIVSLASSTIARGQQEDKPNAAADRAFEALLADARKDPEKADWVALRHAFAKTSHYNPYNIDWRKELADVRKDIADEKLEQAAASLETLLERERFMRLDALALAVTVHDRLGQKDKLQQYQPLLEGFSSALFVPDHGVSFEKPIEVLFIEEEYIVLAALELKPTKQMLAHEKDHWFDLFTLEPEDGQKEGRIYFNIDMPHNFLSTMVRKAAEKAESK